MDISTAVFHDSEISKGSDFNIAALSGLSALHPIFDALFSDIANNVVISGLVVSPSVPPSMNVVISSGVAYSQVEEKLLHLGNSLTVQVANAAPILDRYDTLEIRLFEEDTDPQSRAFKDPTLGSITYDTVNTKHRISIQAQCVSGVPGSGVAPNTTDGWMKIAEIFVPGGTTQLIAGNIHGLTALFDGRENTSWTAQKDSTFFVGSTNVIKKSLVLHIESLITQTNAVHGIRQGHGQGFDSDTCDGSHYNAVDVLAKYKTVDGHGSGSDSDFLDGQEGSFYQNAGNLNAGILPLARLPTDLTGKKAQYSGNADYATSSGSAATSSIATSANAISGLSLKDGTVNGSTVAWDQKWITSDTPTWVIPKGLYMMVCDRTDGDCLLEMQTASGVWFGRVSPNGLILSDGVNFRVKYISSSAQIFYRKFL